LAFLAVEKRRVTAAERDHRQAGRHRVPCMAPRILHLHKNPCTEHILMPTLTNRSTNLIFLVFKLASHCFGLPQELLTHNLIINATVMNQSFSPSPSLAWRGVY
jgi:hypothetical protein